MKPINWELSPRSSFRRPWNFRSNPQRKLVHVGGEGKTTSKKDRLQLMTVMCVKDEDTQAKNLWFGACHLSALPLPICLLTGPGNSRSPGKVIGYWRGD